MKRNDQIKALIDAYIELGQHEHYNDSQIIEALADIFSQSELEELGYGGFIKDYFTEDGMYRISAGLTAELSAKDIDDIMCTALEGGICYWCGYAEVVGDYLGEYASEQISRGGKLILHDEESPKKWELDRDKFLAGLKMYVENGGADCVVDECIDPCEIDADAADSIIQYALFGELVFG